VKPARTYLIGLALIVAIMAGVVLRFSDASRPSGFAMIALGLLVQGPLGWWMVKSVGTPRFIGVWVMGMLARFALLAIAALLIFPLMHWTLSPGLIVLAVVLFAMLLLEGLVVWVVNSQAEAQ
jgi:heme A synthase